MKACSRCKNIKPTSDFSKKKTTRDGRAPHCKACDETYYQSNRDKKLKKSKVYYINNTSKAKAAYRAWYVKNREHVLEYAKIWREKNQEKLNTYARDRRRSDIDFKIRSNLRTRLSNAIRDGRKSGSAIRDLGCSIAEFKKYIESQFISGMSWDNYGEWHFDHKIPLSKFDLTNSVQVKKAMHFSNLQPLWAEQNLIKGDKVA